MVVIQKGRVQKLTTVQFLQLKIWPPSNLDGSNGGIHCCQAFTAARLAAYAARRSLNKRPMKGHHASIHCCQDGSLCHTLEFEYETNKRPPFRCTLLPGQQRIPYIRV
eukprot:1139138-Pelagomonas_calceolata.AAC.8